jgi:hypothetical protein
VPAKLFRTTVSVLSAAAVGMQAVGIPVAARDMTAEEYKACQTREDGAFKATIEALTMKALQSGLGKVDYRAAVEDEWRRNGFDDLYDKRVDFAVAEVGRETSLWEKGRSLFDREKAQALSVTVAERVYRSEPVKAAIEAIAVGVAKQIGGSVELATVDAAGPALECLRAFLGPRYGQTVAGVVSREAGHEFRMDPAKASAGVSAGSLLAETSGGLTGVVILAVRKQLANIASRIGQRLVGSVLGRLVSVVAGGVGVILIAKDIWDFRNGVLPIIATEMKSKATKDLVKDELAKAMADQIGQQTREIASATADSVVKIWQEFRRGHVKVLELAERHEAFRLFVDTLKPSDLPRLDEVTGLLLAAENEAGVLRRLKDGTLAEAVTTLAADGMTIARETRSLEQGLQWSALAGPLLPKVIEYGIYRRTKPADFTRATLTRLIGLDDKLAIVRLAGIDRSARDSLFELPDADLKGLARGVTEPELETLARYLLGLEKPARERVLQVVAASPARMQVLGAPRVRDAVIASRDQLAAVSMMLRADSGFQLDRAAKDFELVWSGRVNALLFWDKHPIAVVAAGILGLIVLLILRRLVSAGGRRRSANGAEA